MELGYQQWFESNIDISDVSDSVIDLDLDWVKNNVEFQNYRAKRSISNIINNTGPPDDGYDYTELHDSMSSDVGWKRDYPLILGVMISNSKLTSKYMRSKPNSKCSIKILDGHHRFLTAEILHMKKIPVTFSISITPITINKFIKKSGNDIVGALKGIGII